MPYIRFVSLAALGAALACVPLGAQEVPNSPEDKVELEQTIISGNQALPKVLYIQPWDDSSALPDLGIDPDLDVGNVLRRVYPPAFRRELFLDDRLQQMDPSF